MNFPIPHSDEWQVLAARADMGFGWLLILALLISVGLIVAAHHWNFPYRRPFELRLSLWGILALAFLVRLPHLLDSLWYDETFTAAVVKVPLEKLPQVIMADVHPPANYLVQWLAGRVLGTSEIALRIPSLIAGIVLVWLIYRLAISLGFECEVALNASLLVALLPAAIYYSNEARAYSLMACLAVGALIALIDRRGVPFLLCTAALPWVHNLGYVYWAGFLLLALLRGWYKPLLTTGLLGALWLPFMFQQAGDVSNGFWIPPQSIPGMFWYVPDTTLSLRLESLLVLPTYLPMFVVSIFALWKLRGWIDDSYWGFLFVPPLAVALISYLWHPVYITRAFLGSGLSLTIAWGYVMTRHRLAQVTVFSFVGLAFLGFQLHGARHDLRIPLGLCDGANVAFYTGLPAQFMGGYYLKIPSLLWPFANDLNQTLTPEAKNAFGFHQGELSQLSGEVCLVQVVSPYTTDREWDYILQQLDKYSHETYTFPYSDSFYLYIHRLTL